MSVIWPTIAALVFMLGDILSGTIQAVANGDLSSSKMRQGLWHKASFVLLVMLAYGVEWASGFLELGFEVPLVTPVCVLVVLTETISILENIAKMNPALAGSKLMQLFRSDKMDEVAGSLPDAAEGSDAE